MQVWRVAGHDRGVTLHNQFLFHVDLVEVALSPLDAGYGWATFELFLKCNVDRSVIYDLGSIQFDEDGSPTCVGSLKATQLDACCGSLRSCVLSN